MKKRFCPSCGSKDISHHTFKVYDPGFKYSCGKCKHDFDTPSKAENPNP